LRTSFVQTIRWAEGITCLATVLVVLATEACFRITRRCLIRIRAEHTKNGRERVVGYGTVTGRFLDAYLQRRRVLSTKRGPLFLSESHRNTAGPLSLVMWSKIVERVAQRAGLPRFTTHTPRHLRLTHMARSKMELHQIATYAGHRSLETTMQYIHLSGVELTEAVTRSLAGFESWLDSVLGGMRP
jgi:integrase/recombinase XerD